MAVLGIVLVLGLAGLASYCYMKRQQGRAPQHPDHDRSEAASLTSREHEDRGDDVIGMANENARPPPPPPPPPADPPAGDVEAQVRERAEAQVHADPSDDWGRLVREAAASPPSPPWADDPFFRAPTETGNVPFGAAAGREDPGPRTEGEGASVSSVLHVDRPMQVPIH